MLESTFRRGQVNSIEGMVCAFSGKKFVYGFSDCKLQFVPQFFIKDAIRLHSILF